MCGIAGYFGEGSQEILKKMTRMLRHRGPDDEGFYIENNIGLGHRRLSIIDLSNGRQPMFSENEKIVIVFNGEIYNFKELRSELENKGYKFRTNSDTEIILQAYEEHGSGCFEYFNGIVTSGFYYQKKKKILFKKKLMKGDFEALGKLLNENWLKKKVLASKISNQAIDKLYQAGIKSGAWGGKVLGAGGGGCILFLVPLQKKGK